MSLVDDFFKIVAAGPALPRHEPTAPAGGTNVTWSRARRPYP